MHDITNTIFAYELAFKLVPSGDPEYLICTQDIAISYMLRYRLPDAGYASDLGQAISGYEIVVGGMPDTHRGMPIWLNNLSILLENRYERTHRSEDLDKSVAVQRKVLKLSPKGHAAIPGRLNNLGILLHNRFEHSGDLGDLAEALSTLDKAIRLSPNMPAWLETKGMILLERFKKSREPVDIKQAILVCQKAVDFTTKGDPGLPKRLHHLGHSYDGRFGIRGNLDDINKAIELKYRGINLANRNHRNRARWLDSLAGSLLHRFPRTENLEDLTQAISAQQEAVEISLDATHKITLLNNLASSLVHRFDQTGDMADLNGAILAQHKAIQVIETQPNHPGRLLLMNNLGIHLAFRFQHTRVSTDIDDAIELHQNVVGLTDKKDLAMHSRMDNLASALASRYQYSGESSDLEGAILAGRQAVTLARLNRPTKLPTILSNLGHFLLLSFEKNHRSEDVNEAIYRIQEAISLMPDGHVDIQGYSLNLSNCFQRRFEHTNNIHDINKAITILQKVVSLSGEMSTDMCSVLGSLGYALGLRYKHSGERQDLEVAISNHRAAAMYPIGPPSKRLTAAQNWVSQARLIDPQQTLDGLGMSIELLSQVAGLEQTIEERYVNIIIQTKNLSPLAAATAIANERYDLALEWLEQSRCLVWNQLNRLRAPIEELRSYDEDLADDLRRVSRALEVAASRQTTSIIEAPIEEQISMQSQVNSHLKHSREWDQLLKKIRDIPQFQDFLLPPRTHNLLKNLPRTGFVVIINVFKERCDALALVPGADAPRHIALPGFSYEVAENLRQRLQQYLIINNVRMRDDGELTRAVRPMTDPLDEALLSKILSILWVNVVKPIIHSLGIPVSIMRIVVPRSGLRFVQCRPAEPTRMWWCATGPLASLPLHAAGVYGGKNTSPGSIMSDFVISSYTPTLSALLDRVNDSRNIEEEYKGLLLVSQPKTPGLPRLPGTTKEVQLVSEQLKENMSRVMCLNDNEATLERVVGEMESYSCVHFACHAVQERQSIDSGFYLHDGRLELTEIIKRQFPIADLAFLSACQTSTGEDSLSEEAVHLAAGMLAAGYCGVVATMWSIKDRYGPVVAKIFYRDLRKHQTSSGEISSRGAASALHHAIKQLRESLDDSESSLLTWVPYVHIGL